MIATTKYTLFEHDINKRKFKTEILCYTYILKYQQNIENIDCVINFAIKHTHHACKFDLFRIQIEFSKMKYQTQRQNMGAKQIENSVLRSNALCFWKIWGLCYADRKIIRNAKNLIIGSLIKFVVMSLSLVNVN